MLEPDPALANRVAAAVAARSLPESTRVITGVVQTLRADERFDTILYIDVLEHIQDDRAEPRRVTGQLADGGHLTDLAPAH